MAYGRPRPAPPKKAPPKKAPPKKGGKKAPPKKDGGKPAPKKPAPKGGGRPKTCPKGFFWSVDKKRCVRKPGTKPGGVKTCPEGYYFNHSKGRCVKLQPDPGICPDGFRWSARTGKCVIQQICPPGMNWKDGKCVFIGDERCPEGFHLDPGTNKCVPNDRGDCPTGYGWNPETTRCEFGFDDSIEEDCPEGFEWSPEFEDCLPIEDAECPEGFLWDDVLQVCMPDEGEGGLPGDGTAQGELLGELQVFLEQYELGELLPFVKEAIEQGKTFGQITLEIRDHPVYLQRFPEVGKRKEAGLSFMPEGQILAYRNEAKRLSNEMLGKQPTMLQIADAIGAGVSLSELEHRFGIAHQINLYGPIVRTVLEEQLGNVNISDEDLFEFFSPGINTAQWDEAYLNALYRGRPAALGLGVRSQAEADALKVLGIDPDEAFKRYEGVGLEADRFDRLATIEGDVLAGLPENFGSFLSGLDNEFLVRALVFQRPEYLAQLQNLTSRETARFGTGGGAAAGIGGAPGLLTEAERAQG